MPEAMNAHKPVFYTVYYATAILSACSLITTMIFTFTTVFSKMFLLIPIFSIFGYMAFRAWGDYVLGKEAGTGWMRYFMISGIIKIAIFIFILVVLFMGFNQNYALVFENDTYFIMWIVAISLLVIVKLELGIYSINGRRAGLIFYSYYSRRYSSYY